MIETLLLVALGFSAASLLALLIAPASWRRAVRLTTRRLEATMPISVADINADKDLIRAESAVEMRRLELELEKARERAARHLMERNMHTVEIGKLETKIAELESTVTERSKAGLVLEQTVSKRIPDLEGQIAELDHIIAARDHKLAERARSFNNQGEALTLAQTMIRRQEQEIERLRSSLESGVGSQLKHFGRTVDVDEKYADLARQKGKVEVALSHLRQDMAQLKEVEVADAAQLRRELQHLAGHMLSGTAPAKPAADEKTQDSQTPPDEHINKSEPKSKQPKSWRGTKQTAKPRKSLSDRLAGLTSGKRKADSKQKADA